MKPNTFYDNEVALVSADVLGNQEADGGALAVASSSAFLPRIQLYGGNSDACKEGKIPIGQYGLVTGKDDLQVLGAEVEVLVLAGRAKALQIGENIITIYDHTDPVFKQIAADSEVKDSGAMFGPEYLFWVPSADTFATFFMSSKTARREAKAVHGLIGYAATLKAQYIKTEKYSWHGPKVVKCTAPTFEVPDAEALKEEVNKFRKPPKSKVETVTTSSEAGGARER